MSFGVATLILLPISWPTESVAPSNGSNYLKLRTGTVTTFCSGGDGD